jgi:ankyrin repeat protein
MLEEWLLYGDYFVKTTGYSPLHVIAHADLQNVLRWSIESLGIDMVNVRDPSGRTSLFHAVSGGNTEIIKLLLERYAEIDYRDNSGQTPLSYAAAYGNTEAIRLLLERSSEMDSRDEKGRIPLSYAALYGNTEAIRLLLERNSGSNLDINYKANDGSTALSRAVKLRYIELEKLLREHGEV